MRFIEDNLELALIKASETNQCSIRELEYDVIQFPRCGFLGFFKKKAIIEVKIKKIISDETLKKIKNELCELFCNEYFEVKDIAVKVANENSIDIELICNNYDHLIGKDAYKYKYLDIIINHYTNVKYSIHSRVEINGILANLRKNLEKHLQDVKSKINALGKAHTKPLEISLLNLVYEEMLQEFPHKNISIKESSAGRYISIYGEFKKQ